MTYMNTVQLSSVTAIMKVVTKNNKIVAKKMNPLNAELNPICHLLALLGVHHILHVSRIRVKSVNHI